MSAQTIKLTRSEEIAEDTMAFHFTRPSGFDFRAGQSVDITLIDPPETDTEGNARAFSLASPPFEDHLAIATRMRDSAFKRVLRQAPQGLSGQPTACYSPARNLKGRSDAKDSEKR